MFNELQLTPMSDSNQHTVVIVADSHFHLEPDAAERHRLRRFLDLLEMSRRADHLVLLGDIFDFWFDYPHFRLRGYDDLLAGLDEVKTAGTRIHFIGGNHDIWAARYLHQRYDTEPLANPLTLTIGGLRVRFEHGDGLLSHDWLYNTFRTIVRTRCGIVLAKLLHPEILFWLSTRLSRHSRGATRDEAEGIEAKAESWLAKQSATDWDQLLIGHVHHRFEIINSQRRLAALAGWFDQLDYAVVRDGRLVILDFDRDPLPEF